MKLKIFNYEKILLIILSMVIFCYYLKDIPDIKSITIIGDEFGYWNAGAWFAGVDWSSVAKNNAYYSYGYGIVLAPLFFVFDNSVQMYQAALVLNAVCVVVSFLLLYNILKRLIGNGRIYIVMLSVFALMFSCNVLYFSKVTMCEIWGMMVFLFVCYFFINFGDKQSFFNAFILGASASYLFFVHQRMIGITISVFVYILYKKLLLNKRLCLTVILLMGLVILLGNQIKENYKEYYYAYNEENVLETEELLNSNLVETKAGINDFDGQIGKVKYIFSTEGIKNLTIGICGKFLYLGAESYLFLFLGILYMLKTLVHGNLKERNSEFYIFLLLNLFISVVISSIFVVRSYDIRSDVVFYGRYNEQFLLLVSALGCVGLLNRFFSKEEIAVVFMIEMILGVIIMEAWLVSTNANDFNYSTVIAMADVYYQNRQLGIQTVFNAFLLRSVSVAIIIQIINSFKVHEYIRQLFVCCIIIFMGIYIYSGVKNGMLLYRADEQETNLALAEIIEEYSGENLGYCSTEEYLTHADYMQYILKDKKIACYTSIDRMTENIVLTCIRDAEMNKLMEKQYYKVGKSRRYILWKIY